MIEALLPNFAARNFADLLGRQRHAFMKPKARNDVNVHAEGKRAVEMNVATIRAAFLLEDFSDRRHDVIVAIARGNVCLIELRRFEIQQRQ